MNHRIMLLAIASSKAYSFFNYFSQCFEIGISNDAVYFSSFH